MSQDIKVKASVTHRTIKSTGKVGFIRSVDESEPYTGSYDITVLNTTVLPTNNKRMTSDLTVRQGAETYTGATTVSVEYSDVVLNTQNKLIQSNITVKQGFPSWTPPSWWPSSWIKANRYEIGPGLDYDLELDTKNTILTKDIYVKNNVPTYAGQTYFEVTDTLTIPTYGFKFDDDLTVVNGVPLYRGATSFTIVDSGLTIATNGKRLNSDITVDISALETLATEISEVVG